MRWFVIVAGLACVAAHAQTGPPPIPGRSGPSDTSSNESQPELLLVDVIYEHFRLESALPVWQDNLGRRFLPLRQISSTLGYRLRVDSAKRTADGFLATPSDTFDIDCAKGTYTRRGKTESFDPNMCFDRDGDLYVDAVLLCHVAGLHFTWRLSRLELDVTSDVPLSIQTQWMQRRMAERAEQGGQPPENLDRVGMPYRAWSFPSLNVSMYSSADVGTDRDERSSRLSIDGAGDLMYMSARYRLLTGSNGKPTALLTLGRQDPGGRLLGPMRATQFAFGDLSLAPVPLLARGRTGIGATLSNYPLPGTGQTAASKIEGSAPPGSVVELYRGDLLVSIVRPDSKGHYTFTEIPLEAGPNELRIITVGAEGEIQEEHRTLYGDASGPRQGESRYRVTAAQVGHSFLGTDPLTTSSKETDRREYVGEYQWGLMRGSWLSLTAAEIQGKYAAGKYLGLGFHSWAGGVLWHAETMASDSGGAAFSAGVATKIGNSTLSLEHTKTLGNFGSSLAPEISGNATAITRLRLDGLTTMWRRQMSYGLSIDRFDGSNPLTFIRARLSGGTGRLFFSNTLALRLTNGPLDATGLMQFRKQVGGSLASLDVGYGFGVNRAFQYARVSMDRAISMNYRVRYGMQYDATRNQSIEAMGTVYRILGPLAIGLGLTVDSRGGLKANILLSTALAGEDADGHLGLAPVGSADVGKVAVRVFLDRNLSDKFDDGDQLLPNVGVIVGGRHSGVHTGRLGTAVVDRLMPNQEITIAIDEDSFDDPCWAVAKPGTVVIPRPGMMAHLDFAVIETAEIEGRVGGDGVKAYPGLTAELTDSTGKLAHTSVVDTDGSYVFSRVRPGTYRLRLTDITGKTLTETEVKVAAAALMKGMELKVDPKTHPKGSD